MRGLSLPPRAKRGEGDQAKPGGGVAAAALGGSRVNLDSRCNYPSTMLRMVPLPICDGEAD